MKKNCQTFMLKINSFPIFFKIFITITIGTLLALFFSELDSYAQALFIHDYTINEFVVGTKKAELAILYNGDQKYLDKKTTYTGNLLKKWFGTKKTIRESTHILLDKDIIREVDYVKNRVLDFPLKKITDPDWYDRYSPQDISKPTKKMIDTRYHVQEPLFTIKLNPEKQIFNKYSCSHITADVRLETIDKTKNASSITLIKLELWLTNQVPGFTDYEYFNEKLGKRLGLDAARLGPLENILDHWHESLDSMKKYLKDVNGYPVKKELSVTAVYKAKTNTPLPEITRKEIKNISEVLQKVILEKPDIERFIVPPDFKIITVE